MEGSKIILLLLYISPFICTLFLIPQNKFCKNKTHTHTHTQIDTRAYLNFFFFSNKLLLDKNITWLLTSSNLAMDANSLLTGQISQTFIYLLARWLNTRSVRHFWKGSAQKEVHYDLPRNAWVASSVFADRHASGD